MNNTTEIINVINNTILDNITNESIIKSVINMPYITFTLKYIFIAFIKLGLSVLFSFIISIERELHSHPGGACTHTLAGLGSCLFTMISIHLRDKIPVENADPARICAQIVSGMGFLGSATIFKSNNYVKGINTAANLWISAAISMAIGADLWELGLVTAGFTMLILLLNNRYKRYRYGKKKKNDDIIDIESGNMDSGNMDDDNNSTGSNASSSDSVLSIGNIRTREVQLRRLPRDAGDAPYGNESDYNDD